MTLTKNTFTFICSLFCALIISDAFGQSVSKQESNLEINQILESQKNSCSVPLDLQLTFNSKVDKVYNVKQVEEGINISGNKKVIINTGVVYLKGKDSKALYSPEKIEREISKKLQKLMNIRLENAFRKIDSLNLRIAKWDSTLVKFGEKLKTLSNKDPKKRKGIALLKQYKQNIQTASCLNDDYGKEMIVEIDKSGNKEFLFDIETIKNDPNYLFVGEESEGFIVVKKMNRFGYLSTSKKNKDIPLKFSNAKPFLFGRAIAKDRNRIYVINKEGKTKFSFSTSTTGYDRNWKFSKQYQATDILTLNESRFIGIGVLNGFKKCNVLLNQNGKKLSDCYHKVTPVANTSSLFIGENFEYIPVFSNNDSNIKQPAQSNNIETSEYIKDLVNQSRTINPPKRTVTIAEKNLFDVNGEVIFKNSINPKKLNLKYSNEKFTDSKASFSNILVNPKSDQYVLIFDIIKPYSSDTYYFLTNDLKKIENKNCYKLNVKTNDFRVNRTDHTYSSVIDFSREKTASLLGIISYKERRFGLKKFNPYLDIKNTGIKQFEALKTNPKSLIIRRLDVDKSHNAGEKDDKRKRQVLFDFSNHKELDIACDFIIGINSAKKIVFIGDKLIISDGETFSKKETGFGMSDFNGLYLIPPIFKSIVSQGEHLEIESFEKENYIFDYMGNCIKGNCKKYRKLKRDYFTLLNKFQN